MEEDEIKKELQPQGIIAVKRISIRYSLYVLTIKGQTIPKKDQYWIPEKRNTTAHSQPSKMFSMPEICRETVEVLGVTEKISNY